MHANCCDPAGSTWRHYAGVRELLRGIIQAGSCAVTEPRGLTITHSRPADFLTGAAVPGRRAALAVTIAAPLSFGAHGDAVEA